MISKNSVKIFPHTERKGNQIIERMTDVSMRIAFVTGASSGLGRDFVLELAGKERGLEEICSTAAFQPFPYLNLYAASKAFLYRYSRGLRREIFGRGILVTAVCPYWIKDTEFITNAKQSPGKHAIRHFPLASRSNQVAKWALLDSRLGLSVSTPGPICMIHRIAAKFLPSWVMMDLWEVLRRL